MGGNDMLLSELAMASGLRFEGEDTDIVSIEYDSRRVKKAVCSAAS